MKDEDPEWIEFDDAPRTNSNPVYNCIYQRLYKRLPKAHIVKEAKPVAKKEKMPTGNGNAVKEK